MNQQPGSPTGRPSPAWTAVISVLFSLFGLIPAALHSSRARAAGQPSAAYWVAFGVGFLVNLLLWALLLLAGLVWLSWLVDDSRDGDPALSMTTFSAPAASQG